MASSAHKLVPSDPEQVMVIRKLTPDVTIFSTPFLRFGRIKIGGRGTAVRLQTGSVAVFSPVALTTSVRKETEGLGTVKYLVAPDQEHHIFLEEWHKAYPDARVIAPETLPSLRDKQGYFQIPRPNWTLLRPHATHKTAPTSPYTIDPEFDADFHTEYVHSHMNKELVFAHKPSGTLIEADLLFNLPATEQFSRTSMSPTSGLLTRLFAAIEHTRGPAVWQKRFLWYVASAADRPAFDASMRRIADWRFERLVPCHGDVVETGAKGVFEKVMEWHLREGRKRS